MSVVATVLDLPFEAAEDLSNDQFRFVVLGSDGKVRRPDSATEIPLGILQNAPDAAGKGATVRVEGTSKLQVNAAVDEGDYLKAEYVDAADAGKGQSANGERQCARARVLIAAGAEDELPVVLLQSPAATRQSVSVDIGVFTANATRRVGLLAVTRAIRITKIAIAIHTLPADADGAMTLAITNYDSSATADDNLLTAATENLKTLTVAKVAEDLVLTATAADLVLGAGDYVFASLVHDAAAIDTNMAGAVVTIEFDLL